MLSGVNVFHVWQLF